MIDDEISSLTIVCPRSLAAGFDPSAPAKNRHLRQRILPPSLAQRREPPSHVDQPGRPPEIRGMDAHAR